MSWSPQDSEGEGEQPGGVAASGVEPGLELIERVVQTRISTANLDGVVDPLFLSGVASLGHRYAASAERKARMTGPPSVVAKESAYYASLYVPPNSRTKALQASKDEELNRTCTFVPDINPLSAKLAAKRAHSDLASASLRTAERRHRAATNPIDTLPFKPQINAVSAKIADLRNDGADVPRTDRMYRLGMEWNERKEAKRKRAYGTKNSQYPFAPNITRAEEFDDARPFVERATEWQETRDTRRRELFNKKLNAQADDEEHNCTFQPRLNRTTSIDTAAETPLPPGSAGFVHRYQVARAQRKDKAAFEAGEGLRKSQSSRGGDLGLSMSGGASVSSRRFRKRKFSQKAIRPEPFHLGTLNGKQRRAVRQVVKRPIEYKPVLSARVDAIATGRAVVSESVSESEFEYEYEYDD